jgi:hypothetical protein
MAKRTRKVMPYETARDLLEHFPSPPGTRQRRVDLLNFMGYTNLRGPGELERCPDGQITAVSMKLYEEALEVVRMQQGRPSPGYLRRVEEDCRRNYYTALGLTSEEGDRIPLSELEEMVCQ